MHVVKTIMDRQLGLGHNDCEEEFQLVECQEFNDCAIKTLVCGGTHTILQTDQDEIFVAGNNTNGQLGIGYSSYQLHFKALKTVPERVEAISCGSSHTVFRSISGKLYSCGWNDDGQLCLGDRNDRKKPTLIPFNLPIKDHKCGNYHTLVLTLDGDLYTSGYNFYGQLGQAHNHTQGLLQKVITYQPILRIFACSAHTIVLASDNELYACGCNVNGQLGLGLKNYDKINMLAKCRPFSNSPVKDVACRFGNHSVVLTESGELFATGKNESGQLGIGCEGDVAAFTRITKGFTNQDVIVSVHCGMYHTVVITSKVHLL
jgi:alpha-tubulin suppressor-like RCC1 family protein